MLKKLRNVIAQLLSIYSNTSNSPNDDKLLLTVGAMLSNNQWAITSKNINDYEFSVFSQFGDDGIIQFLIKNIEIKNNIFVEFGVEDFMESNTRFLMMNNNWTGFVMDGSEAAMNRLQNQNWYWKYSLTHKVAFIDKENINTLLADTGFMDIGLLHIDLDGNDYHILHEMNLSELNPSIIILEYNSVFGKERRISIPYDKYFMRTKSHHSNLFWGASLPALSFLAAKKGYSLVGCNQAGNNAYFVRKDLLNDNVKEVSIDFAYRESKFRESRNRDFTLSYLIGVERIEAIKGLQVLNVETNQLEDL